MERLVPDTSVFIDWFNSQRHEDVLFRRDALKYLCAVVAMELLAGVRSARDRRAVVKVTEAFRASGRVLVPSASAYEDAGEVLRLLRRKGHDSRIANDVLIALSARSIGASVVTGDGADFEAIRALRPFKLLVV